MVLLIDLFEFTLNLVSSVNSFSLEVSVLALLSLPLAVELDAEEDDEDPLVELDEASLDSDDVEDDSLPSLESLVSLSLSLLVVLFENETLLSELSGA